MQKAATYVAQKKKITHVNCGPKTHKKKETLEEKKHEGRTETTTPNPVTEPETVN